MMIRIKYYYLECDVIIKRSVSFHHFHAGLLVLTGALFHHFIVCLLMHRKELGNRVSMKPFRIELRE